MKCTKCAYEICSNSQCFKKLFVLIEVNYMLYKHHIGLDFDKISARNLNGMV